MKKFFSHPVLRSSTSNERIDLKLAQKDTRQWGEFYWLDVLDNEIPDVWQIRKPVEGFPMLGEEKVYIKKTAYGYPARNMEVGLMNRGNAQMFVVICS